MSVVRSPETDADTLRVAVPPGAIVSAVEETVLLRLTIFICNVIECDKEPMVAVMVSG
jgi:hypothetical protein